MSGGKVPSGGATIALGVLAIVIWIGALGYAGIAYIAPTTLDTQRCAMDVLAEGKCYDMR